MKTQSVYLPSPTEIAEATRKIRAGWNDRERSIRKQVAKRRLVRLSRAIAGAELRTQTAA